MLTVAGSNGGQLVIIESAEGLTIKSQVVR